MTDSGILTAELAEKWITNPEGVKLESFSEIEPAAASVLCKPEQPPILLLSGLEKLSVPAAKGLNEFNGILILKGITQLDDDLAKELSRSNSRLIDLGGLTQLSDQTARWLGEYQGGLILSGLKQLSETSANGLAANRQGLALNGLLKFSVELATCFERFRGPRLLLDGLQAISNEEAKLLGELHCELSLNSLSNLSSAVAESLGRHKGRLSLDGIVSLSETCANGLRKNDGQLSLGGLKNLSDEAIKELSLHRGELYLSGLESLSLEAAESLADHDGRLDLSGLRDISDQAAEALRRHEFVITNRERLPESAAEILDLQSKRGRFAHARHRWLGAKGLVREGQTLFLVSVSDARFKDGMVHAEWKHIPSRGFYNDRPVESGFSYAFDHFQFTEHWMAAPHLSIKVFFDRGLIDSVVRFCLESESNTYDLKRFDEIGKVIRDYGMLLEQKSKARMAEANREQQD